MNVLKMWMVVTIYAQTIMVVTLAPALKIMSLPMMESPVPVSDSIHL